MQATLVDLEGEQRKARPWREREGEASAASEHPQEQICGG